MFLFAEQDADVVVQEPLQSTFLHAILFCNMCRLCRGERTGKLADNGLLLAIQYHFADYVLYAQSGLLEILRQPYGTFHSQQINVGFIAFTTSPPCQLNNQTETDDVYFQLAINADNRVIPFTVA